MNNRWMRRLSGRLQSISFSMAIVVTTLFLAAGMVIGYFFAARTPARISDQLYSYVFDYLSLSSASQVSIFSVLFCYFRVPILLLLFAFSFFGCFLLPLFCFAEGAFLSFSLCSFAIALGRELFPLLPILFLPRMFVLIPLFILLSSESWEQSQKILGLTLQRGKRVSIDFGTRYWYRLGIACILLALCACYEFILMPQILSAIYPLL